VHHLSFTYELTFIPIVDAAANDVLQHFGDLPVVVRADSVARLDGATITVTEGALSIDNPNSASPKIPSGGAGLTGPVADQVRTLLETQVNPAIAAHGGFAELVAVEGDTAYLRLGGGCQGCGLAAVTLRQGIEVAIKESIPEILNVVDVTDHASGENPYFESSKK
jgi:Fe/S biogenesis protein NfuA